MRLNRFAMSGIAALAPALVLASCGGGSVTPGTAPPPAHSAAGQSRSAQATFRFSFRSNQSSSASKTGRARPQYVSSGTQSIVVTLTAAAIGLPNPNLPTILNVTSTTGNGNTPGECGPDPNNTGNTLCTLVAQLPIGSDTLQISTYDEPQSQTESAPAGALLSQQIATETIVQGVANSFPITLDANPNNVTFSATPTSANVTGTISGLTVHGNGTATATIALTDAAGKPIVGPGAPTLSVTTNSAPSVAAVSISGATLTITPATAAGASGTTMVTLASNPATASSGLTSGTVTIPVNVVNVSLYGYGYNISQGTMSTTNTVALTAAPKVGDLLFAMVHVFDSTPPASVSAPAGWSEVANCAVLANGTSAPAPANCDAGSPSTKSHGYLFEKTATAADVTAYSYTFNVVGDAFAEIVGATNVGSLDGSAATLTGAVEPVSPWVLTGQPVTQTNPYEVFLIFSGASESSPLVVALTPGATFTQLGNPTYQNGPDAAGAAWSAVTGFTPTVTWTQTGTTDPVFVTIFTQGLLP